MGILKCNKDDEEESEDNNAKPEPLIATKFLQSLDHKVWNSEDISNSFTEVQRRLVKRAKLPIIIID